MGFMEEATIIYRQKDTSVLLCFVFRTNGNRWRAAKRMIVCLLFCSFNDLELCDNSYFVWKQQSLSPLWFLILLNWFLSFNQVRRATHLNYELSKVAISVVLRGLHQLVPPHSLADVQVCKLLLITSWTVICYVKF